MLFNKNSNGIEELKARIGFIYSNVDFANIQADIDIAETDIIKIIGQAVYDRAKTHYASDDYEKESPDETDLLNDNLVHHIQTPVGFFAYKEFSANRDVSHEDTGRKVKIDDDNEKIPFEWMLERDDASIIRKAHKTTERLIAFLETNENSITEWKGSAAQTLARNMFINSAAEFDKRFPIDESRRFYLTILPFMKEVEETIIKPTLNPILFDEIKTQIQSGTLDETNAGILELVQIAIPFFTMQRAVKRLSLQVIPEGVIQSYISDRSIAIKGGQVPTLQVIKEIACELEKDGMQMLSNLQQHLAKLLADETETEYLPDSIIDHNEIGNKHFRV